MTESLKVVLSKKAEDLTDADREEMNQAAQEFAKAVMAVCEEHGLEYACSLDYTPIGIVPKLQIIPLKKKE